MSTWFDAGRRAGLHAAVAQLTARKQRLLDVYNTTDLERICDIYDIRQQETQACLDIVQQILEAKMDDMFKGPVAPVSAKYPLPRIGSKAWGWVWDEKKCRYVSALCPYVISQSYDDFYIFEVYPRENTGRHHRIGTHLALYDAKTLAESRARRDWRKENRKK